MSKIVWIATAQMSPENVYWFEGAALPGDEKDPSSFRARNEKGEALSDECFHQVLWTQPAAKQNYAKLPHLFAGPNGLIVSGECADLLQKFDLGNGNLYPVQLLNLDKKTPVSGAYFYLNIGNTKDAILPVKSQKVRPAPGGGLIVSFTVKDNDLAVSENTLSGPDVWVDSAIRYAFFLSNRLAKALSNAGMAKPFRLRKCRIAET